MMSFRKIICLAALFLGACFSLSGADRPLSLSELKNKVNAKAVLMVDGTTGEVLFQRDINTPYLPASTVKLMTALLAYEKLGVDQVFVVDREATKVEPSYVPLRKGEKVSVEDMLKSILIGSDNDSAVALAVQISGSVEKFAQLMNQRAKELGCTRTHFTNPNGLPDSKQVMSAGDLMKIFRKTLEYPGLRQIMQTKYFSLRTRIGTQRVKNHNKLLGQYEGMGPAKTGWTYASRHTYAAAARRNGREIHLVLLSSVNKWSDARALFDYGFAHLSGRTAQAKSSSSTEKSKTSQNSGSSKSTRKTSRLIDYKVKKGDSLYGIAKRFGCKTQDIQKCNPLSDPNKIKPGQIIKVPGK